MIGYLKVNHLKGCHMHTDTDTSVAPRVKVAVDNAEPFAVDDDRRCSSSEARDASGLSVVKLSTY